MEKQNKQVNAIKHKGKKFSPAFQRWRGSRGRSLLVAVAAGTDKLTFHYEAPAKQQKREPINSALF